MNLSPLAQWHEELSIECPVDGLERILSEFPRVCTSDREFMRPIGNEALKRTVRALGAEADGAVESLIPYDDVKVFIDFAVHIVDDQHPSSGIEDSPRGFPGFRVQPHECKRIP